MNARTRPILMFLVVILTVGAYVSYRKAKQPPSPDPIETGQQNAVNTQGGPGDDQGAESNGQGSGDDRGPESNGQGSGDDRGAESNGQGSGDDRGPESNGRRGEGETGSTTGGNEGRSGQANDQGVEPGEFDPEGLPGEHGPRSQPVCIKPAPAKCQTPAKIGVTVSVSTPPKLTQAKGRSVTLLMLTTEPISDWKKSLAANIHAFHFSEDSTIKTEMAVCANQKLHLCAIRTTDYQEFGYAHVGGCVAGPSSADQLSKPLAISMRQLETTFELIGLSALVPQSAWPGTEQRIVNGTIQSTHPNFGGALVAVGTIPLVDQPDAEANPSALAITDTAGRFKVSFLAKPSDPIFVCGLSFPKDFKQLPSMEKLDGAACIELKRPQGASTPVSFKQSNVSLNSAKTYPLTAHEREHYSFLGECLKR